MSMMMLTILQIIWVVAAYLGVTLLLPWLLLRKKLVRFRLPARFMAYFVTGNFFCINLVFLVQLLHISNRATLIVGTLFPFLAAAVKHRKTFLETLGRGMDHGGSISEGEVGSKTLVLRIMNKMRKSSSGWLSRWLAPRWLDVLLAAAVILLTLFMYGVNTVSVYGYCASDLVTHNHWINCMETNQIFVDGVYPFGFHCMIYYLHEVFAVPTYVLLRVFALPQTLMIHLMLLAFLKLVCKSKYAPYAGMAAYITSNILCPDGYYQYYAPLPQEFGMLFILPAAYFVLAFLQDKDLASAVKEKRKVGKTAGYSQALFGISFSLTLAAHFYDAIVAGLLCAGIVAGFCFRIFRWQYLKRLVAAGAAGHLIGALPMAAAYVSGIPVQSVQMIDRISTESGLSDALPGEAGSSVLEGIIGAMQHYATNDGSRAAAVFMLGSVGVLLILGLLWCVLLRGPDYGCVLVSFGVFMGLLCVFQAAANLGLPQLLELTRCPMYIGYGMAAVWSLCIDGLAYLLFRERKAINLGALAGLAAACIVVAVTGVRTPVRLSAYEPNGAIICLTNILRENKDSSSWTICSANDEQQMIRGFGYHYETIDFLRNLEGKDAGASLTIPTETVYFFIEKVPILYHDYLNTAKPEREVSQEGARMPLPAGTGIEPYIEDARWITMSHMYHWAQAFRALYPYELEVYYETDDFVCYRIRQDEYSLYNFAIDYEYERK